jgi:hypothetical protein
VKPGQTINRADECALRIGAYGGAQVRARRGIGVEQCAVGTWQCAAVILETEACTGE